MTTTMHASERTSAPSVQGPVLMDSPEAIATLRAGLHTARANAILTRAGELQREVRMLRRGWAVRVAQLSDGRRQVLNFILPGDLFDLEALLMLGEGVSNFVTRALTDVEFYSFSTSALQELIAADEEQNRRVQTFAQAQLAHYGRRIADLGQRTAPGRAANLILELHDRLAERGMAKDGEFDMPARQDDLADALGLTPVHVNRTLRMLRERDLVDFGRRTMRILDRKGLEAVGDEQ